MYTVDFQTAQRLENLGYCGEYDWVQGYGDIERRVVNQMEDAETCYPKPYHEQVIEWLIDEHRIFILVIPVKIQYPDILYHCKTNIVDCDKKIKTIFSTKSIDKDAITRDAILAALEYLEKEI